MAWRIEDCVARGEIDNRTRGGVKGKVWLAGRSDPLVLHLAGNCHGDLAGCLLVFSNSAPKPDSSLTLASDQRGVAGDITASHKVRVIEGFDYEAIRLAKNCRNIWPTLFTWNGSARRTGAWSLSRPTTRSV